VRRQRPRHARRELSTARAHPAALASIDRPIDVPLVSFQWLNQLEDVAMFNDEEDDKTVYKVVLNHEEQYSIWPAERDNPLGWRDEGQRGLKVVCLEHIEKVWTDMRPLSLRQHMEKVERERTTQ
jgi:MbtH protein